MLDPAYSDSPSAAEHLVGASLRPAVAHRRRSHAASLNQVSDRVSSHRGAHAASHKRRARAKRRA